LLITVVLLSTQADAAKVLIDKEMVFSEEGHFIGHTELSPEELEADDSSEPIIAVMAFTDAASSPTESGSLIVNELEMTIVKPGTFRTRRTYVANVFATDSWYSRQFTGDATILTGGHNNVKVIRIPAGALTDPFTLKVSAVGVNAKAVPGISGETENQDFALYVYNAVPTS